MAERKYPTMPWCVTHENLTYPVFVGDPLACDRSGEGGCVLTTVVLVPVPEGARMDWPVIDGCVAHMRAWMVAIESRCLGYDDEDPCVAGQILLVPMAARGSD
jgi:hypothetical protein